MTAGSIAARWLILTTGEGGNFGQTGTLAVDVLSPRRDVIALGRLCAFLTPWRERGERGGSICARGHWARLLQVDTVCARGGFPRSETSQGRA